jgi:hypothetical protein
VHTNLPCTLGTHTEWLPSLHPAGTSQSQSQLETKHHILSRQNLLGSFLAFPLPHFNRTQDTTHQSSVGSPAAVDRTSPHYDSAIYSVASGPGERCPSRTAPSLPPLENKIICQGFSNHSFCSCKQLRNKDDTYPADRGRVELYPH